MLHGNSRVINILRLGMAAAILVAAFVQAGFANPPMSTKKGAAYDPEFQFLKKAPDLPYLPQYSGNVHYRSIVAWPKKPGGPAYSITFCAKEDPASILDFYKTAFRQYKWVMLGTSRLSVSAERPREAFAVVTIMHQADKDYTCSVHIAYKVQGLQ